MKKVSFFIIVLFFKSISLLSQVAVNTTGSPPDSSAMFEVESTSRGFLIPRMNFEQRNAITNPAEGLILYCTDCSPKGKGLLCIYQESMWKIITLCNSPDSVLPGNSISYLTQIIWTWHQVPSAVGYKWHIENNYGAASDLGNDTSKTETNLVCGSTYTRYVWAYNDCGYSVPLTLTKSTLTCWTCGESLTIHHVTTGGVAPVDKTVTYGTVNNIPGETSECWITSNLGSNHQATAKNDTTEASAGWYWQFNRMQGYKNNGLTRTPNSSWINSISEFSEWTSANDPCTHELGSGWRVPTENEWINVDAAGNWTNWDGPWNSALKLHAAGYLYYSTGELTQKGSFGYYWSSNQSNQAYGNYLSMSAGSSSVTLASKATGQTIRCIHN